MELDGWLVGAPEIGWKKNPQNGREVNPGFHQNGLHIKYLLPCPEVFALAPDSPVGQIKNFH
jgi:hypothetical protein